jgi:hypothetical protein
MGIFVLSKDQTFRISATFFDPAKLPILVIHIFNSNVIKMMIFVPNMIFIVIITKKIILKLFVIFQDYDIDAEL